MPPISRFILPPRELSSCIAGCIYRNTRGTDLSDEERLNYFPASPLFSATVILEGELHVAEDLIPLQDIKQSPIAPQYLYARPKSAPHMSWSSGPTEGLTIAFFPDAWKHLGGRFDATPPECLPRALAHFQANSLSAAWPLFWQEMTLAWGAAQRVDGWSGSDRLAPWAYHLMSKAAQTGTGRSLRSIQRRIRRWTGHDTQTLSFFAKIEELHRLVAQEPSTAAVDFAVEAGFADQSHMGRAVKRATGFSPVQLNQLIAENEAFWCYRLLGERF